MQITFIIMYATMEIKSLSFEYQASISEMHFKHLNISLSTLTTTDLTLDKPTSRENES